MLNQKRVLVFVFIGSETVDWRPSRGGYDVRKQHNTTTQQHTGEINSNGGLKSSSGSNFSQFCTTSLSAFILWSSVTRLNVVCKWPINKGQLMLAKHLDTCLVFDIRVCVWIKVFNNFLPGFLLNFHDSLVSSCFCWQMTVYRSNHCSTVGQWRCVDLHHLNPGPSHDCRRIWGGRGACPLVSLPALGCRWAQNTVFLCLHHMCVIRGRCVGGLNTAIFCR